MPQTSGTSFNELLDLHARIDETFFAHQSALLRFDFANALAQLELYGSQLREHMLHEEEILLPLYAARSNLNGAGAPQIFLADHAKMREFVDLFTTRTVELAGISRPEHDLLQLLDREAFYKRLCSHHDKREREFLYPTLDSVTTDEERREILLDCDLPTA